METLIVAKKSKTIQEINKILNYDLIVLPFYDYLLQPGYYNEIINWGSASTINFSFKAMTDRGARIINSRQSVHNASNKLLCRQILAQSGIPTPELTETEFPCIGRPINHSRGRRFFVCHNPKQVRRAKRKGAVYFSKFYPKQNEFRVHIGHNKVLLYSIKIGDKSKTIWNHSKNGFEFKHLPRKEWDIKIIRLAKRAIKAIGLDFGAVDIMADPINVDLPIAVVCEINTAPALSGYGLIQYAKYFYKIT